MLASGFGEIAAVLAFSRTPDTRSAAPVDQHNRVRRNANQQRSITGEALTLEPVDGFQNRTLVGILDDHLLSAALRYGSGQQMPIVGGGDPLSGIVDGSNDCTRGESKYPETAGGDSLAQHCNDRAISTRIAGEDGITRVVPVGCEPPNDDARWLARKYHFDVHGCARRRPVGNGLAKR